MQASVPVYWGSQAARLAGVATHSRERMIVCYSPGLTAISLAVYDPNPLVMRPSALEWHMLECPSHEGFMLGHVPWRRESSALIRLPPVLPACTPHSQARVSRLKGATTTGTGLLTVICEIITCSKVHITASCHFKVVAFFQCASPWRDDLNFVS